MKLVVGLGNPGKKYRNTRHNLGFMVVDALVKSEGISWRVSRDWICYFAKTSGFVIIKPSTFVNKSGEAVRSVAEFFQIAPDDILVVHDDLDLPFGKVRISFDSIAAGHHGIESVIESLGGPEFGRLRIGIGSPENVDGEKFVLEDFSVQEKKGLGKLVERCSEAIKSYLDEGIDATMNRFN